MSPKQLLGLFRKPRELRYECDSRARIASCHTSDFERVPARLMAIWQSGLEFSCGRPIPVASYIEVQVAKSLVFGKVRACRPLPSGGFRIEMGIGHVEMPRSAHLPVETPATALPVPNSAPIVEDPAETGLQHA